MTDYKLQALNPISEPVHIGTLTLTPINAYCIFSLAFAPGDRETVSQQLESAFGLALPEITQSTQSSDKNVRCLSLQREQVFLVFDKTDHTEQNIREAMNGLGYVTDQSDSWMSVLMTGSDTREALARMCQLDLHETVFIDGMVARTSMEHLSVIILRDGEDFLFMSPTSSAQSFMHAVKQSAQNVSAQ